MFYGSVVVKFFGCLTRWIFTGFTIPFKDIWQGPKEDKYLFHGFDYALVTNIIGFITIFLLGLLMMRF